MFVSLFYNKMLITYVVDCKCSFSDKKKIKYKNVVYKTYKCLKIESVKCLQ